MNCSNCKLPLHESAVTAGVLDCRPCKNRNRMRERNFGKFIGRIASNHINNRLSTGEIYGK